MRKLRKWEKRKELTRWFIPLSKLLDIGRSINVELEERNLATDDEVEEPGTWCWHAHITAS